MPITKLVLNIDQELHRRLKSKTAMEGRTITSVLVKAIEAYLQEPKPREKERAAKKKPKG